MLDVLFPLAVIAGGFAFVFWVLSLAKAANAKILKNMENTVQQSRHAFHAALSEFERTPEDVALRANAVEKGHIYYKAVGAHAVLKREIEKAAVKLEDEALITYQNDFHARDNRVQADIQTYLTKGKVS